MWNILLQQFSLPYVAMLPTPIHTVHHINNPQLHPYHPTTHQHQVKHPSHLFLKLNKSKTSVIQFNSIRGRAHCKLLCKYCIFRCCTHFGHIAASPYAKWLNPHSASYGSLVAAASLNTRSFCKLCVISAVVPHSSPALQVQSMKGGIWTKK